MFVKPMSEGPAVGETILIPGRPVEVDLRQVRGDIGSGIRFELEDEDNYSLKLPRSSEIKAAQKNGERVFVTEDDDLLFVAQ